MLESPAFFNYLIHDIIFSITITMKNIKTEAAGLFSTKLNKALLVGIKLENESYEEAEYATLELERLVATMGIDTVGIELFSLRKKTAALFLGKGNAEFIRDLADNLEADCIIFDQNLSPAQQRNWEAFTGIRILDRQEVIIDIFAGRAQTKEAQLQVELARLEYLFPRLKGAWTHLSRQKGGMKGTRDAGEKQLELDRRVIEKRIKKIKDDLKKVKSRRSNMRKNRDSSLIPSCSIVGYTNAGKSSLLNNLANTDIFAEDKLFATLDPTSKNVKLGNGTELIMTDTVGFIQKLPHNLVDAFKSTLEEAIYADFILILIDITDPWFEMHITTTEETIIEAGAINVPRIYVFNKIDSTPKQELENIKLHYPDFSFISAKTGLGIDELKMKLESVLSDSYINESFFLDYSLQKELVEITTKGIVKKQEYREDGVFVQADVPKQIQGKYKHLICK